MASCRIRFEDLPPEVHRLIYSYAAENCDPISPIVKESAAAAFSPIAQYIETGLPILHQVFPSLKDLATRLPKYYSSQVFQFDLRDEVCGRPAAIDCIASIAMPRQLTLFL